MANESRETLELVLANQIYGWKKQVLDNVTSLFACGASAFGGWRGGA
jgi:hypothetical protein